MIKNKLFILASLIGIFLAIFEVLESQDNEVVNQYRPVATINDAQITLFDYLRTLKMLDEDRRGVLSQEDRSLVLTRLVEEELLYQYGIEQQIHKQPDIKKLVIKAMLENITTNISSQSASYSQVQDFYNTELKNKYALPELAEESDLTEEDKEFLNEQWLLHQKNKRFNAYLERLQDQANIQTVDKLEGLL